MVKNKLTQKVEHEVRFNNSQALWSKSDKYKFKQILRLINNHNACIAPSKCQKIAEQCPSLAKIGVLNLKKLRKK